MKLELPGAGPGPQAVHGAGRAGSRAASARRRFTSTTEPDHEHGDDRRVPDSAPRHACGKRSTIRPFSRPASRAASSSTRFPRPIHRHRRDQGRPGVGHLQGLGEPVRAGPAQRLHADRPGPGRRRRFRGMGARVSLKHDSHATLLAYAAQAEIGGKLASVGSRLLQTVAEERRRFLFGVRTAARRHGRAGGRGRPWGGGRGGTRWIPAAFPGGGLGAPVPAWLVVFGTGLGLAWAIASPSSHADG